MIKDKKEKNFFNSGSKMSEFCKFDIALKSLSIYRAIYVEFIIFILLTQKPLQHRKENKIHIYMLIKKKELE